ncbi:MAG TPA: O-antigen ligase family protein [Clostridia bacterium]|nr:O-antigen ligase family protein [Clostridia bacterium]HOL61142.1 O-antigen ligase family protein [Clostridia bacterium]HPO53724.1 O-antigen ligase family protein [Clostridia bacterium]
MKVAFTKAIDALRKFCLSDWFIYFTAVFVMAGWLSGEWMIFMGVLFAIIAAVLVLCEDVTPALAPFFLFTMMISSSRSQLMDKIWMLSLIVLPVAAIIYRMIKNRDKLSLISPTKWTGFTLSLILLILPMTLGGLFRGGRIVPVIFVAMGYMILLGACYLFFSMNVDKKNDRVLKYVLKLMFVNSIIVSLQLIITYGGVFADGGKDALINYIKYKNLNIGWAGGNNAAPVLAMCMPAGLYYALKDRKASFIFILVAFIEYALVISTGSRGTILILTIALPFILCYMMAKSPRKLQTGLTISVSFAVAVLLAGLFAKDLLAAFSEIINRGLSDNGRFTLYKEALGAFVKYPVFGAGWDYRLGELYNDGPVPYWYHSTALQILANMGVIGAIFFGYFYYWRYRTLLADRVPAKLALFAGVLIFDLYGMIDVNFFGPTFFVMMLILTFAVETTIEPERLKPLPITLIEKRCANKKANKA